MVDITTPALEHSHNSSKPVVPLKSIYRPSEPLLDQNTT